MVVVIHPSGELGCIVPGRDLRGQPAAHHDETRRRTQRRISIGGIEDHTFAGQPGDRRRLYQRVTVAGQKLWCQPRSAMISTMLGWANLLLIYLLLAQSAVAALV